MNRVSRRVFLTTSGVAAGGAVAGGRGAQPSAQGITLTLTGANYVRFLPIATGDVRPRDLALGWVRGERNEMLRRATDDPTVDGGETSMAQHVQRLDRGDRSLVAIPIFPLRNFTARDLYTRQGTTIDPGTLDGRRVGIYNWAASGAVWYRHLLRHLGTDTKKVHWVVGGVDGPAHSHRAISIPRRGPLSGRSPASRRWSRNTSPILVATRRNTSSSSGGQPGNGTRRWAGASWRPSTRARWPSKRCSDSSRTTRRG